MTIFAPGISLRCGGAILRSWTGVSITRDLQDISGSFSFEYNDTLRDAFALPAMTGQIAELYRSLVPGLAIEACIDDEVVLRGWIDDVDLDESATDLRCTVTGRDVVEDLVDCTANPEGPAEYRGLDLLGFVSRICAPFGISVTADVDVGDSFHVLALDACEMAMAAIEKAARQRAVLVNSDGVGGLVLTRAGTRRGPAPIVRPGNVFHTGVKMSWRQRYSDYYEKGQTRNALRGTAPSLDATVVPFGGTAPTPPAAGTRTQVERSAIVMTGHSIDPVVTRYRPRVWLAKTQSGGGAAIQNAGALDATVQPFGAGQPPTPPGRHGKRVVRRAALAPRSDASPWTLQDQADWRRRTFAANATQRRYTVRGWRAGHDDRLWRPNEIVLVRDDYTEINADQLVGGVVYRWGTEGALTTMRVVHPDAYDLRGDADDGRHAGRRRGHRIRATDPSAGHR